MRYSNYVILLIALFNLTAFGAPKINKDEIKIVINNWSSQIVLAHVVKSILSKMGHNAVLEKHSFHDQWGALARGIAHIEVEVWGGTQSKKYKHFKKLNKIVEARTYKVTTREEWWYPEYVEKDCPELPHWTALFRCAHLFNNTVYSGPWKKTEAARAKALNLTLNIVRLENSDKIRDQILKFTREKRPILAFNWTPNWTDSAIKGKFIEFPKYEPECETNPQWGINKNRTHDCATPSSTWLKSAVWVGLKDKWPCAFQLMQRLDLRKEDFVEMAANVDVTKLSYKESADMWLKRHQKRWQSWVPTQCK